jgi:hypothetical protein
MSDPLQRRDGPRDGIAFDTDGLGAFLLGEDE